MKMLAYTIVAITAFSAIFWIFMAVLVYLESKRRIKKFEGECK